jgi:hypothetical protein
LRVVDDCGDGAAEVVRGDVLYPERVYHVTQERADVVRRVRRPHPRAEQERALFGAPLRSRRERIACNVNDGNARSASTSLHRISLRRRSSRGKGPFASTNLAVPFGVR